METKNMLARELAELLMQNPDNWVFVKDASYSGEPVELQIEEVERHQNVEKKETNIIVSR